jgi:hypothetical protein
MMSFYAKNHSINMMIQQKLPRYQNIFYYNKSATSFVNRSSMVITIKLQEGCILSIFYSPQ